MLRVTNAASRISAEPHYHNLYDQQIQRGCNECPVVSWFLLLVLIGFNKSNLTTGNGQKLITATGISLGHLRTVKTYLTVSYTAQTNRWQDGQE